MKINLRGAQGLIRQAKEEIIPINSVHYWKDNPKSQKDFQEAARLLAPILKEHGQITPVVVWTRNKTIYKGNTTKAAQHINKATHLRVQWADFVSEQAATAYGIADNQASTFAKFDDQILRNLITAGELPYRSLGFSRQKFEEISLLPAVTQSKTQTKDKSTPITVKMKCPPEIYFEFMDKLKALLLSYKLPLEEYLF